MTICKQHHQRTRNDGMTRGSVPISLAVRLTRGLVWPLCVMCLCLLAGSGWAANSPDVRILTEPMSHKTSSSCSNLGNLMTITRAVQNFGGPLRANRYYLYVSEITDTYTHGNDLDAHLHSKRYYLPAMPAQGQPVQFTMVVGTTASFSKKIPGPHALAIGYYTGTTLANGIRTIARKHVSIVLPRGICQPKMRVMSPAQMHLKQSGIKPLQAKPGNTTTLHRLRLPAVQ